MPGKLRWSWPLPLHTQLGKLDMFMYVLFFILTEKKKRNN